MPEAATLRGRLQADLNACESRRDGSMVLYFENLAPEGECFEVVIPRRDVERLVHSAIDALQKKWSTR
jgi:hypothetical protein